MLSYGTFRRSCVWVQGMSNLERIKELDRWMDVNGTSDVCESSLFLDVKFVGAGAWGYCGRHRDRILRL